MSNNKMEVKQTMQGLFIGGQPFLPEGQIKHIKKELRRLKMLIPLKAVELELMQEDETEMTIGIELNKKQAERFEEWKDEQKKLADERAKKEAETKEVK